MGIESLFWQLASLLGSVGFIYVTFLYLYRLVLHPLAKFPGPKLAAVSNWYEFYYDVVLEGQFTTHIAKLHEKYGPIIRITPDEIHINDAEYYDQLYTRTGRRDKSTYMAGRFGFAGDSFSTTDHDLHRLRRKPLSPFFSAKRIGEFQPVIRSKVEKLCSVFEECQSENQVVSLSRAFMALTTDIITEYAFGKSYNQLYSPGFEETLHESLFAVYGAGQVGLHFPFIFPLLDMLPEWFVFSVKPELKPIVGFRKDFISKVKEVRARVNDGHMKSAQPTIFHDLLLSDLPPEQKTDFRLGDEAQLIISAGLITTSWSLTVASFHIASNPTVALKLYQELHNSDMTAKTTILDWHKLEVLPYLNGCVHECIRLAYGVATRIPVIARDTELSYGQWRIPKDTPVSITNVHVLMNESIFPDPNAFRPERWMENPGLEKYFVAFGKGTRQCIGINLAQAELYLALAMIFTRFKFELYETDFSDIEMAHAFLVPYPQWGSKGVRATVKRMGS